MEVLEIENKKIELGNVEKTFYEEEGISKGAVIDYYKNVAEYMLPFIEDRPLMLQRFPNGISKKGFYQKERPDYFPSWIDSVTVSKREGGAITHVVCNDVASLVYIANQACITLHTWQSKKQDPERPDKIVIDIDPSTDDTQLLKEGLGFIRKYMDALDIVSYPMTTGSKGYHVVIPIVADSDFDEIRERTENMTKDLAGEHHEHFTTSISKKKRKNLIYLDIQRNAYAQTSIAPYSLRPKPHAPVAVPVDWTEAMSAEVHSQQYTLKNIFRRLSRKKDPWHGFFDKMVQKENLRALKAFDKKRKKTDT